MATPNNPTSLIWLSALREVAHHFGKIGEVIAKCADDSEKALNNPSHFASKPPTPTQAPQEDDPTPHSANWPSAKQPYRYNYQSRHATIPPPGYSVYYPPPPPGYMPVPRYPPDSDPEQDEHPHLSHRRKRRGLDPEYERDLRAYDSKLVPRGPRPSKRVRINWTEEENKVFFDAVTKNAMLDEPGVLRQIVAAMDGTRNWVQCKGHFRNLCVVGRIVVTPGPPKRWAVLEDTVMKRPTPKVGFLDTEVPTGQGKESGEEKGGNGGGHQSPKGKDRRREDSRNDFDVDEDEDVDERDNDGEPDEDYVVNAADMDEDNLELGEMEGAPDNRKNSQVGYDGDDEAKGSSVTNKSPKNVHINGYRVDEKNSSVGKHAVPPRKQVGAGRIEDFVKYQTLRRGREVSKRRSSEYRSSSGADGRFFPRK